MKSDYERLSRFIYAFSLKIKFFQNFDFYVKNSRTDLDAAVRCIIYIVGRWASLPNKKRMHLEMHPSFGKAF